MSVTRREFMRVGGSGFLLAALDPRKIFGQDVIRPSPLSPFYEQLASDEFPFPFDTAVFEAAERISNVRRSPVDGSVWLTDLNLILKTGTKLDIKILTADRREDLSRPRDIQSYSGVTDSLDMILRGYDAPRLHYQVQYREGQGAWRALPPRTFKLPNVNWSGGDPVKVAFIGDDHNFDDADYAVAAQSKPGKKTGDYVVDYMKNLRANPEWKPDPALGQLWYGFLLAKGIQRILSTEDPDFFINLGDTTGIGAPYKWANLGFPTMNLTGQDYDNISRALWLRQRKLFSGLTPNMPTHLVLGNHDGEEAWNPAKPWARKWRLKYFPGPTSVTYPEGGHPDGNYYAFSWGSDKKNEGGVQFIVLDVTGFCGPPEPPQVQDWTLGPEQNAWYADLLAKNEHDWVYSCFHHTLGGWPTGSDEANQTITYGRGPLFTEADYADFINPALVEQVRLTNLAAKFGMRGFIYGHDHIFKVTRIGSGLNQKDLSGIVVGSTKRVGEANWWRGAYWKKHYGNGFKTNPDFFGPSGITRLTLTNAQARFEYICTGNTPDTNLPSGGVEGTLYSSAVFLNAAPALELEKTAVTIEAVEGRFSAGSANVRIRNSAGRKLNFTLRPQQNWIQSKPIRGNSWGLWVDITISVRTKGFKAGTYEGAIRVESTESGVSPQNISVVLTVLPAEASGTAGTSFR